MAYHYKWKPSASQKREFAERMKDPEEQRDYSERKAEKKRYENWENKDFIPTKEQHDFCFQNIDLFVTPEEEEASQMVVYGYSTQEKINHKYIHIVNEKRRGYGIISGIEYGIDQFLDKDIYLVKDSYILKLPENIEANYLGLIKAGGYVGKVYSYIQKNKDLYFMFYAIPDQGINTNYYLLVDQNLDEQNLIDQGILNVDQVLQQQQQQQADNETIFDKIFNAVKILSISFGAIFLIKALNKK